MGGLLIVTAVEAEAAAVLAGLADRDGPPVESVMIGPYRACRLPERPDVTVLAGGIGPAAAGAATGGRTRPSSASRSSTVAIRRPDGGA